MNWQLEISSFSLLDINITEPKSSPTQLGQRTFFAFRISSTNTHTHTHKRARIGLNLGWCLAEWLLINNPKVDILVNSKLILGFWELPSEKKTFRIKRSQNVDNFVFVSIQNVLIRRVGLSTRVQNRQQLAG